MQKWILVAAMAVSGCSLLDKGLTRSAHEGAKVMSYYCQETDQPTRDRFRRAVNGDPAANGACGLIWCPAEQEPRWAEWCVKSEPAAASTPAVPHK